MAEKEMRQRWFQIYKNGFYTGRDVAISYFPDSKNIDEKVDRLMEDYPESEGYYLKQTKDVICRSAEDIVNSYLRRLEL